MYFIILGIIVTGVFSVGSFFYGIQVEAKENNIAIASGITGLWCLILTILYVGIR